MTVLRDALQAARRRAIARVAAFATGPVVLAAALGWRFGGPAGCGITITAGIAIAAGFAWHAAQRLDARWLARRLDALDPRMEDSADLLFAPASDMTPLERLQQARLHERVRAALPDPRVPWTWRAFATSALPALALGAAVLGWPTRPPAPETPSPSAVAGTPASTRTRLISQRVQVVPPAYTGLPTRDETSLDSRVPEAATVRWQLEFSPAPAAAKLAFHDGTEVALTRAGNAWAAARRIDKPVLYRIVLEDAPALSPDRLHRIDVVADRAPRLEATAPEATLTLRTAGQRRWTLAFEAEDDYGLAATAPLRIVLAQGTGENITFQERTLVVRGTGRATRKRYAHALDLAATGMAVGDDLVVQLRVSDNRAGNPQETRSASYILRWAPPEPDAGTGVDGLVRSALPAYFRSQRQVVNDSEALLADRPKLAADTYLDRSDAIGVDQRLLRLRYGQFLGEEAEGAPTGDHGQDQDQEHEDDHAGEAAATEPAPVFGQSVNVLEAYGHTHDDAEVATLLDPETRRLLKSALDEMWQSELHLRQGHPDRALPYAYRALDFIKQVQQANRVHLARTGPQLPPIDFGRRLSGDRAGLASRNDPLVEATPPSPVLAAFWRALEPRPAHPDLGRTPPDFDAAEQWLREREGNVPDALGAIAAIDSVRREPDCVPCRRTLRERLWPLLSRPPSSPQPRPQTARVGQAYLDALEREAPP